MEIQLPYYHVNIDSGYDMKWEAATLNFDEYQHWAVYRTDVCSMHCVWYTVLNWVHPEPKTLTPRRWWWMSCVSVRFGGPPLGSGPPGSWTSPGSLPLPTRRHPQPTPRTAATRTRDAAPSSLRWVLGQYQLWLTMISNSASSPSHTRVPDRMFSVCVSLQVLHTHGTYQEVCPRPCPQPTSCRPCMPSPLSSRGWPWSNSGSTDTITCTEDHCPARRTTTGEKLHC